MIRYLLYFFLVCHLFVLNNADPIIGNNTWPAIPNQFPFIASIRLRPTVNRLILKNSGHYCSGSLITTKHVITAAHCLEKYTKDEILIIIGAADLIYTGFTYEVDSWKTYVNWLRELNRFPEYPANDIAIIKLTVAVNRPGIRPVILTPLNNQQLYGTNAIIIGWKEGYVGSYTKILHTAKVTILTPEECIQKVKLITNIKFTMGGNTLCSSANPYALTTKGDSGGPVLNENNVLVGVGRGTSPKEMYQWGNFTVEFTNQFRVNRHLSVDYYREFIENVTELMTTPREILSFEIDNEL